MKFGVSLPKKSLLRKWGFTLGTVVIMGIGLFLVKLPKVTAEPNYNFAEALQKSLYFYDAEKCGPGITGGRLEWRGDCHVEDAKYPVSELPENVAAYTSLIDPDDDGVVDLSGGYHDAGDHVRFGLPQGYAFSTLGWGFYKFRDAFVKIGEEDHMIDILKWFSDCYLKTIYLDSTGKVAAFCYMVGKGEVDHTYWGPPEYQLNSEYPRPATFATADSPASDMAAEVAAGLALMYLNFKDTEAEYAARCRDYAIAMYDFAKQYRGLGKGDGFYGSAYDEDELSWAAVWLYVVTGELDYIQEIAAQDSSGAYTGYMKKIINTVGNDWQNIWTHCWDVVWAGVFTELAGLFPDDERFDYLARWNLEYFSGGSVPHREADDSTYLTLTPAGYAMINTWGSARYNCAAQLCALVYQKDHPDRTDIADWARGQMEYIMGNNPMGYSYIVGYGSAYAQHPHHRAAHGSTNNNMNEPAEHRHILWGALVGGPDGEDFHNDVTTDFVYNEVAIDYNAAFVGALAGHYLLYGAGQEPLADFPPAEAKVDEFYAEAKLEQENDERTQVTIRVHNDSCQPPRYNTALGCRYYFNISELMDAGQSIDDVSLAIMYDQVKSGGSQSTQVTGPFAFDAANGIYYIQIDWTGVQFFGTRELHFALVAAQDSDYKTHWDPTNDYSRQEIDSLYTVAQYIPVYSDGVKVYGEEPAAVPTSSPGVTPSPTPEASPAITVSYACYDSDSSSNMLKPWFQVKNSGKAPLDLTTVKLRYWYTVDTAQAQSFFCDYTKVGSANITGSFVTLANPLTNADSYFELGFTSDAGKLGAGASTGDIQIRIYKNDYTPYEQSNDYSFDPDLTTMGQNSKITGYINGELVFGVEP
ncbi:MAG: glycoside hydrolase family 9 protein [Bacillota bacterium]|jgi:endoglucanase